MPLGDKGHGAWPCRTGSAVAPDRPGGRHQRGMINDFVIPYVDIRNRARGYAVSIVEAGLTAVGRDGGRVRPPLTDLTESAAHRHPDGGPRKGPDGPEDPCGCPTQAPSLPIPRPARSRTSRPHEASVRKPQHAGHSLWPLRHSSAKLASGTSPGAWARTGFRGQSSGSCPRRATPLLRSARMPSVIAEVQQPFDASVVDRAMRGWSRAAVTLPDRRHIGGRHHADRRRGT